jgi:Outer membrane receptor proteins, mostly Fe transport
MKKLLLLVCLLPALNMAAESERTDSVTKSVTLDEVLIKTNAVSRTVPMAMQTLEGRELRESDTGRDLPWLLMMTPSVVTSSDNGLGLGLTSFRIRGTDASRINLTYDGVALNSPEDQTVFWANMNAFAGSVEAIQVQRGVGTSTNGSGAFGATVTMLSQKPSFKPSTQIYLRGGSYGTWQYTAKGSTGLMASHWVAEGRYSQTLTDGYIDRTAGNLGTHYAAINYYGDDLFIQLKNFGSFEHTGQAWNGVPSDSIAAGNRTYNNLGEHIDDNGHTVWKPTTDNYVQNNTQLSFVYTPLNSLQLHGVLHYTFGRGYYDDYKADAKYYKFRLDSYEDKDGHIVSKGDLIRQKWLRNHNMGGIFDIRYTTQCLSLISGLSFSHFIGAHWGLVPFARNYPKPLEGHFYDSDATKSDATAFAKAEYSLSRHLLAYADMQFRYIDYRITGMNDKFYDDHSQQPLNVHERFPFFNPKAGLSWRATNHTFYASYARAHREPTRNDYTDAGTSDKPLPETLNDIEAGYQFHWQRGKATVIHAGINAYLMDYDNQLIQTGQLSDIGEALATNVADSYRHGIELTAGFKHGLMDLSGNCTISENKIINFTEYVDNWEGDPVKINYPQTDLAFSPALTAGGLLRIGNEKTWGSLSTRYVGRQFLDNTSCADRSIAPYCVSDLQLGHAFRWQHYYDKSTDFELTLNVNNLFNAHYATGGWIYTAVGYGYTPENRYREDGLFVQAPLTAFFSLSIKI